MPRGHERTLLRRTHDSASYYSEALFAENELGPQRRVARVGFARFDVFSTTHVTYERQPRPRGGSNGRRQAPRSVRLLRVRHRPASRGRRRQAHDEADTVTLNITSAKPYTRAGAAASAPSTSGSGHPSSTPPPPWHNPRAIFIIAPASCARMISASILVSCCTTVDGGLGRASRRRRSVGLQREISIASRERPVERVHASVAEREVGNPRTCWSAVHGDGVRCRRAGDDHATPRRSASCAQSDSAPWWHTGGVERRTRRRWPEPASQGEMW